MGGGYWGTGCQARTETAPEEGIGDPVYVEMTICTEKEVVCTVCLEDNGKVVVELDKYS